MTYTSHGHHISGTIMVGTRPDRVARCGGPGLCKRCSIEAAQVIKDLENNGGSVRFGNRNEGVRESYPDRARRIVKEHYNSKHHNSGNPEFIELEDCYVVWFAYILGGWKALVSTTVPDDRYYEVTYDKNRGVAYLDEYQKTENVEVRI